jgi:hypothetical protein
MVKARSIAADGGNDAARRRLNPNRTSRTPRLEIRYSLATTIDLPVASASIGWKDWLFAVD